MAAGRPACVSEFQCDPADVDPRFLLDEAKIGRLEEVVARHWPEKIEPGTIQDPGVIAEIEAARQAACAALELSELA